MEKMLDVYSALGRNDLWFCDLVTPDGKAVELGAASYGSAAEAIASRPGYPVLRVDDQSGITVRRA